MQECTCVVFDKFLERDSHLKLIQFLMKLNEKYESFRSQILAMGPLPDVNKAYYIVQQIEKQKQVTNHSFDPSAFFANTNNRQNINARRELKQPRLDNRNDQKRICTNCGQDGHVFDQCFKRIVYPDWYKGKKVKKGLRIAAHVSSRLEELVSGETPFDLGSENEISGGVDQRLVAKVCSEMMKMFKGKGIADESGGPMRKYASTSRHASIMSCFTVDGRSLKVTIVRFHDLTTREIVAVGKGSRCLYICKPVFDLIIFAANIAEFRQSHKHLVPSTVFNKTAFSNAYVPFALLHMDLWDPYKKPALNEAHYFFTIVYDRTRATWTYLVHRKDQISDLLDTFLAYVDNHFKAKSKYITSDNATYLINKMPMKNLNWKSLYEVLFGKPPDFSHLRTIGCLCYAALTRPHKDKFENRGVKDVIFEENVFPFKTPVEVIAMTSKPEYPSFEECSTIEEPLTSNTQSIQPGPNTPSDTDLLHPNIPSQQETLQSSIPNDPPRNFTIIASKLKEFLLPTQLKLSLTKGTPLRDASSYRRLVGRLLYLTMTRPDISYDVQHLSQFVSSPKDVHTQAALHLLKYLKVIVSKGLFYPIQSHLKLTGLSDADWT
uniref:CCHC-type domain-containing protein n=1 Tax=Tanacetum cinerariifolium TaxID=118510 RepID=A0A6L2J158_TANCI|nr:hypothetical protein [Tanacetum cinerariifolium]